MLTARAAAPLPAFHELRELIRTNVLQVTDDQLDQAAGGALLGLVHGRLLDAGEIVNEESDAPAIADKRRFEPGCLYVRVGQVTLGLAPQLAVVLNDPAFTTNSLGLILDLRFAGGTEYAGAASTADLFNRVAGPLLDWGSGHAEGTEKTNAWTRPVAVLVNHETRGAAEALVGILRLQKSAMLLGGRTSGTAAIFREIPLADGRRLRLAVAGIRTGDGQTLPSTGLPPDIAVILRPELERAYLADPFNLVVSSTNSNSPTNRIVSSINVRRRINEAELVRARKTGETLEADSGSVSAPSPIVPPLTVRDPVLARALDLLKGLHLLRPDGK